MRIRTAVATVLGAAVAFGCGNDDDITNDTGSTETVQESFVVDMIGAKERPDQIPTFASGTGTLALRQDGDIDFVLNATGLTSAATAAHIHGPADVNQAADVIVDLGPVTATTSGMIASGRITKTDVPNISLDSLRSLMRLGMAYVNIHTSTYPTGEIRGQVVHQ